MAHRTLTQQVSPEPTGTLSLAQLASSLQLYDHLLTRSERKVVILSKPEWTELHEPCTFREAADRVLSSHEPLYTANTHTALFAGAHFFVLEGDMMENLVACFDTDKCASAFSATEDMLIGFPNSYTSPHLDNAPCNPNRVTVLVGTKRVAAWPFRASVMLPGDIQVSHVVQGRPSHHLGLEDDWKGIEEYALEQGGWVREDKAGEYITFPSFWWHAAFNVTGCVSVNNTFMTAYDVAKVLFNTVRLGVYRTKRQDIFDYNRPVKLGGGLADAFEQAFDIIFQDEEGKDPWEISAEDAERKGAWLYTATKALTAYQAARAGTRGNGGGDGSMQAHLAIEGFAWNDVSRWLSKIKKLMGDTPNARALKKRKEQG